jgi:hypothetical protein
MTTLTTETITRPNPVGMDSDTPTIAHLPRADDADIALCGTRLTGGLAPDAMDRCLVCLDMGDWRR